MFSGFTTPMHTSRQLSFILTKVDWQYSNTNESCLGLVNGYAVDWTSGSSEPGSSGSGLFTTNGHYLVGALSCGPLPSTCNSPWPCTSKFANFYPQIRQDIYSGTPSAPIANPATFVASTVSEPIGGA